MKKLSIEYVKAYFLNEGYTPLFDKYVGNKIPLKVMCPKGHTCYMLFNNFRRGCRCITCLNNNKTCYHLTSTKYNIEYVKGYFIKEGYVPLFDEYINSNNIMKTQCPNGHIYYTNFNNFKNHNYRCRKCFVNSRRYTIEQVKSYFLKEGYVPLFDKYVNNKTQLKTMCPNGHIYFVNFGGFKNLHSRCPICSNRKKYTMKQVKAYFLKEGYIPLFNEYVNKNTNLKIMCPKGHIVNMTFGNFSNGNRRCVVCYRESLKGEGHHSWKGGISFDPYCPIFFDKEYKESIKIRDSYTCQNPYCYKNDDMLNIHHIDYNKKNCGPENLITVCRSCNSRANSDREWHTAWYQTIINHKYGYVYNEII